MTLRCSEVDLRQRSARTCRTLIHGSVWKKPPTKTTRKVLLNDRALHALEKARPLTAARSDDVLAPEGTGERSEHYVRSKTGPDRYGLSVLRTPGLRYRSGYEPGTHSPGRSGTHRV